MKTLLEVLQAGTDYLARQGCDEARATMQHLLAHVLHCNRTALYSQFDRPVEEAELAPLRELLKRRAAGEPLEHRDGLLVIPDSRGNVILERRKALDFLNREIRES